MAKISPLMLVPPLTFLVIAGLFGFGMLRDDPDALPSARAGQQAPAMTLTDLTPFEPFADETLTSGGVKLVNFWASWCAPCRAEHRFLDQLQAEGVPIYGINYKDDPEKAKNFLADLGNPYAALAADPEGRTALDWGLYGVPETYVLDADGTVILRFAGPITESILASTIRPAMAEAAGQ